MEWRHGGSPRPKNFWCKNPLEIFSPRFFGIKTASFSLIIFQRAKLLIEGHFEGKTPREGHQVCLVLAQQCPGSPGTCNPEELAYLGFHCLDHSHYSPNLAPSDYHLFRGLKKQLKARHFSSDAEVIAAAETWLDGQTSEFF